MCGAVTNKCKKKACVKNQILISGTKIRKYLINKRKIPTHLMSKEISSLINFNSLIK
jgi:ATP sulfurylase